MSTKPVLGSFLWYELMTKDPAGSLAFYPNVTGWGVSTMPSPAGDGTDYSMFAIRGTPFAGCMLLPAEAQSMGAPSHWLGYVGTTDVDATVAQAAALGATVYKAGMDIPHIGRIAVLADPQGASFALFRPESGTTDNMGGDGNPQGGVAWHELMTTDIAAAWDFYAALFGWTIFEDMDMGEHGMYRMFGSGEAPIGGIMIRPPQVTVCLWSHYVNVLDLEGAIDAAKQGGGVLAHGPVAVPGGDRIAQLVDPQGALFCLHTKDAQA
ncbi:MAG: VOC family protein [Myxococcales bacterium]|nr:VOC family protein [Myxococcales bacterium]